MKTMRSVLLSSFYLLLGLPAWAADGVLDVNFHSPDGAALWDSGTGYDRARAVPLQPDGKILVTGYRSNGVDDDVIVLRRENGICEVNDPNEW